MNRFIIWSMVTFALGPQMACQPPGAPASGNSASASNQYCIADIGPDAAGAKIKEVFGLLSPSPLNLTSVTPEGALYKVTFEFLQGQEKVTQSVYITKDGQSLIESLSDIDTRLSNLKKDRDFVSCLKEKGVKIFVSSKDRNTLSQLKIFGQFGGLITIDCAASEDNCKANGVTKVPSVGYQGKLTVGAQERAWFETLTLCK